MTTGSKIGRLDRRGHQLDHDAHLGDQRQRGRDRGMEPIVAGQHARGPQSTRPPQLRHAAHRHVRRGQCDRAAVHALSRTSARASGRIRGSRRRPGRSRCTRRAEPRRAGDGRRRTPGAARKDSTMAGPRGNRGGPAGSQQTSSTGARTTARPSLLRLCRCHLFLASGNRRLCAKGHSLRISETSQRLPCSLRRSICPIHRRP